jgi:hypothetical protein
MIIPIFYIRGYQIKYKRMNKILLFFVVFFCSCKGGQHKEDHTHTAPILQVNNTNQINDIIPQTPIDTATFLSYWHQFRKAVLSYDTIGLASMVNDSVINGWFLIRNYTERSDKMPQAIFLKQFYNIFTPPFLSLLELYNIREDLFSNKNENPLQRYRCTQSIGNKRYRAWIEFDNDRTIVKYYPNSVNYYMFQSRCSEYAGNYVTDCHSGNDMFIEQDIGSVENITFHLGFIQTISGIKLNNIGFSYNMSISD